MPDKHLIIVDLDGTLLTNDKKISPYTKQVLQQAMNEGHEVAIATGRPYRMSKQYYQELRLQSPIVNFNGALSHHPYDLSFEKHHITIPLEQAQLIIETCHSLDMSSILVEIEDHIYTSQAGSTNHNFFTFNAEQIYTGDLIHLLGEHPTSMLVQFHSHHDWNEIQKVFTDRHSHIIHHRRWNEPFNVMEILRQGVHKAIGVERIAHYYGIPKERIIAFGDEDNDLEMLQYVGKGIAMGNAIDSVKKIANDITEHNENDGIAKYLQSYLNLQV